MSKTDKILNATQNKVQLNNISPKSEELRRVHKVNAMRENKLIPTHLHPTSLGDKVAPSVIRGGAWANPKRPNQAMPVNRADITPKGPYNTGDGDFPIAKRPGADDHKQYQSRVTGGTITYPRGHV